MTGGNDHGVLQTEDHLIVETFLELNSIRPCNYVSSRYTHSRIWAFSDCRDAFPSVEPWQAIQANRLPPQLRFQCERHPVPAKRNFGQLPAMRGDDL